MGKIKEAARKPLVFDFLFFCGYCNENKTDLTVNHGPGTNDCQRCGEQVVDIEPIPQEKIEETIEEPQKQEEPKRHERPVFGERVK